MVGLVRPSVMLAVHDTGDPSLQCMLWIGALVLCIIFQLYSMLANSDWVQVSMAMCDTVLVTQLGHRSSIRSLSFHPYSNYIATGSADTNVKVSLRFINSSASWTVCHNIVIPRRSRSAIGVDIVFTLDVCLFYVLCRALACCACREW